MIKRSVFNVHCLNVDFNFSHVSHFPIMQNNNNNQGSDEEGTIDDGGWMDFLPETDLYSLGLTLGKTSRINALNAAYCNLLVSSPLMRSCTKGSFMYSSWISAMETPPDHGIASNPPRHNSWLLIPSESGHTDSSLLVNKLNHHR